MQTNPGPVPGGSTEIQIWHRLKVAAQGTITSVTREDAEVFSGHTQGTC